jgi:hypothetical protein
MGEQLLIDCQVVAGKFEFSGTANAINMDYGAEIHEVNVFNVASRRRIAGLENVGGTVNGYWDDLATVDAELFERIGLNQQPFTAVVGDGSVGDRTFMTRGVNATYNPQQGSVGEVLPYEFNFEGYKRLYRGNCGAFGTKTSTANEAGVQLGQIAATNKLVSALHVVAWNATSLDVTIEKDVDNSFSTPTTVITFTQATGLGSEWMEWIPGAFPETEEWYRVTITLVGTSAKILVPFAIGK